MLIKSYMYMNEWCLSHLNKNRIVLKMVQFCSKMGSWYKNMVAKKLKQQQILFVFFPYTDVRWRKKNLLLVKTNKVVLQEG